MGILRKIASGTLVLLIFLSLTACNKGSGATKGDGSKQQEPNSVDPVVSVASSEADDPYIQAPGDYKLVTATPALDSAYNMSDDDLADVLYRVVDSYQTLEIWLMCNGAYDYVDESLPVLDARDCGIEYNPDYYPDGIRLLPLSIFRTQAEMEAEWRLVLSEEFALDMLAVWFEYDIPKYVEIDGQLYVAEYGDGSTMGYDMDEDTLSLHVASDTSFSGTVWLNWSETFITFYIVEENGRWVLNDFEYGD